MNEPADVCPECGHHYHEVVDGQQTCKGAPEKARMEAAAEGALVAARDEWKP